MSSFIIDGMFILIVISLAGVIFKAITRKEKLLGNNKYLSTLSVISMIAFIAYMSNSYLNKNKIPEETFSFKIDGMTYLLSTREKVKINIRALWEVCTPADNFDKKRKFNERLLNMMLLEPINNQIRDASSKSKDLKELKAKVNNQSFVAQKLKATQDIGLCVINLQIKTYNKAIKNDV